MIEKLVKNKEILEKYGKRYYHPIREKNYRYNEKEDTVYYQRKNDTWNEMPNERIRSDIKYIAKHGVSKFKESLLSEDEKFEKIKRRNELKEKEELNKKSYKMEHTAPCEEFGVRGDNITNAFSDDIYSEKAYAYHGHGGDTATKQMDKKAISIIHAIKNNPKDSIQIYRAIPKGLDVNINSGDWVTITKEYAENHGEHVLDGNYEILKLNVKAGEIFTDGNSIHEWGYSQNLALHNLTPEQIQEQFLKDNPGLEDNYDENLALVEKEARKQEINKTSTIKL